VISENISAEPEPLRIVSPQAKRSQDMGIKPLAMRDEYPGRIKISFKSLVRSL
jgi:hypothetical protein